MRWINVFGLRLRSLLRSARVEHELDEEVRHHLERQVDENLFLRDMADSEELRALLPMPNGRIFLEATSILY